MQRARSTRLASIVAVAIATIVMPASAATVSKSYSYFTIGGLTLGELETELSKRGPTVKSTGRRHPGATQMEFNTKLSYADSKGRCRVSKAAVSVKAHVILPRWLQRSRADPDTRLIWDTLSADIKRHEESHVIIAKNHARELEDGLKALGRFDTCQAAAAAAKAFTARLLAAHDAAQERFDYVEGVNFESRLLRLLNYRLEQNAAKTGG